MQLINGQILLIELYIILKVSSQNTRNILRILTEITNNPNKTIAKYCSGFSDCFNCTVIPKCRWVWEKESCIPFEPFIEQYSIPLLNKNSENNDLSKLNEHINFIRQCCFNPLNPYIDNSNSYKYSNSVVKYCGPHYLIYNNENINNFKIEIKKVNKISFFIFSFFFVLFINILFMTDKDIYHLYEAEGKYSFTYYIAKIL